MNLCFIITIEELNKVTYLCIGKFLLELGREPPVPVAVPHRGAPVAGQEHDLHIWIGSV